VWKERPLRSMAAAAAHRSRVMILFMMCSCQFYLFSSTGCLPAETIPQSIATYTWFCSSC